MDSVATNARASGCNVLFLDVLGIPFAGLYQDRTRPLVLFRQALQELLNAFDIEFEGSEKLEFWELLPSDQMCAPSSGEPRDGVLAKDLYSKEGNMMKPILPGKYYLYRRKKNWIWKVHSGVIGAVPLTFHAFQSQIRAVDPISAFLPSSFHNISIGNLDLLISLRKKPAECRPRIRQCAISGLPRPSKWSASTKAPELFAYPIVPNEMLMDAPHKDLPWGEDDRPSSRNWISMLSHLYRFFARGRIAIHPDTMEIRCFIPSRIIQPYHGRVASLKDRPRVYRRILGLHYQQCVYANMTAHGLPLRPLELDDWHLEITEGLLNDLETLVLAGADTNEYCTQTCLLGLFDDYPPLDPYCPNFKKHQASQMESDESEADEENHRLEARDLSLLLQHQLGQDKTRVFCEQPRASTQGHHGQLFKLTLAKFGYTLVGKGVGAADQHILAHEAKIYEQMNSLQGLCVPVCLGAFALQVPCGKHAQTKEEITHMLLLSHAGIAVENEDGEEPDLAVTAKEVAMEANRTFNEINKCGVKRLDKRKKHQFWNEELGRVFFIDFEKDSFRKS
ncbi:hypothetical protein N0V93_005410 [Gnomoniopsis smithogilvyi]|uniref:Uncharacterized protein n=1 Tax=Gnomoniopsis smithogilvyi TaxID=1191159 RepID=A0A9W9CY07_9PEZI|nr:hypothetical protein N0V93_005410 [Gnomoniopsis smithogilvyi]